MLIVGNWKAYVETNEDAKKLMAAAKRASLKSRVKIIVAPPFPYIGMFAGSAKSKVALAAQDVSETAVGNATGEVSAAVLKRIGATHVIVGHSERRARGETDAVVAKKVERALSAGLIPILCIGEAARDHDAKYLQVLKGQMDAVMNPLQPKDRMRIVIAYEPIWAIGKSGSEAITPHELAEMVLYVRKLLSQHIPEKDAARSTILYGGSVEPENIRGLAGGSRVDGFLVGRASAEPASFTALVKALS